MNTSPALIHKVQLLKDRAEMLAKARAFFAARGIVEVDCPILSASASIDAHIDLISTGGEEKRYLHSSPEYGMKRLLAFGMDDIFQLSHVFRSSEYSSKHNPEFMMAEWYRREYSYLEMIHETAEFIQLFLGELPLRLLSYRAAIKNVTGIDYVQSSAEELISFLKQQEIEIYPDALAEGKDGILNLILGLFVEPQLGEGELTAITYYPASQSALAKTCVQEEEKVSERFEIYYQGVELANGYHELADPIEQKKRLIEANKKRIQLGKDPLPIDENFLAALQKGLPDCSGVAVGFDRLMMLRHNASHIRDVISFDWHNA